MHADPSSAAASVAVQVHADAWPEGLDALAALPQASFFHRTAWWRALQAVLRCTPYVLLAREGGHLQGACALAAVRRFGLLRLYAAPLGTYGGILARTENAAVALGHALRSLSQEPRVALVRIHDFTGTTAAALREAAGATAPGPPTPGHHDPTEAWEGAPGWHAIAESSQVLDLPEEPQSLFEHSFTAQNRNKIRKAERAGLTVRRGADATYLDAYAALYRTALPRWRLHRPLPPALFAALAGASGVDVWLAERAGRPVAALLNLRGGGQIMNWGNVSLPEAWRDAPNNLLHWRALEAACLDRQGPRLYNFGASAGLPGVHAFKAAFGARDHAMLRLEYRAPWLAWVAPLRRWGRA